MKRWDVIVVGAGPAGSTTAYRLAKAGASVLLLDRARFPRDKPCGGGVTGRAARLLPLPLDPVVEHVVRFCELRLDYGKSFTRGSGEPLAYMTQRRRLDRYLAEEAAAAGAEFRDGVKVTGIEGETVVAGPDRFRAEAIVGADGVNGVSARALALGGNRVLGVALEGNVTYEKLDPERYRGRFALELGTIPGGYGWVFPKGDHANVGVGGWESEGPRLRKHLARLCRAHGIATDDLENVRGFRLPCRAPDSCLARGRALLVGDAAGLVDPVSGDGIYEGFLSSKLASEAIADLLAGRQPSVEPYDPRLTRVLGINLWASWSVKGALDRFPRTAFALARTKPVWNVVERIVRGEMADVLAARKLARPPLKALAVLARAAGDPGQPYREAAR